MTFVFLGHGVAGQNVAAAAPLDSNPDHGLGCRACGPQHGNCGQSLIVKLGHEERFRGSNFLPNLSDPDLLARNRHTMRVVRTPAGVNCLPTPAFQAGRANLKALTYI
jgi:hypothetical protein